jgi:cystathionine gamma-synthase
MRYIRGSGGAVLGSFEAWLLLRGMRTLHLRVAAACANAQAIAARFEKHPKLSHVLYPGLRSHPNHAVAARQMHGGFGAMISVRLRGGEAAAKAFTASLRVFKRATSLGSVESLAEHRASVEGPETMCPVDLVRLSIGVEHADDLIADIEQALG